MFLQSSDRLGQEPAGGLARRHRSVPSVGIHGQLDESAAFLRNSDQSHGHRESREITFCHRQPLIEHESEMYAFSTQSFGYALRSLSADFLVIAKTEIDRPLGLKTFIEQESGRTQ